MDRTQTKQSRYGAPGIDSAAPLATREERAQGLAARVRRGFLSWFKTAVITLGTMYVIGWFVLTVGIAWMNRVYTQAPNFSNTMIRSNAVEPMRAYALPKDPRITLEAASQSYLMLNALGSSAPGFAAKGTRGNEPDRPWRRATIDPTMFTTAGLPGSYAVPGPAVIEAAGKGFNAGEREFLRMVATAPIWREWDRVVLAPKLDRLEALFHLPFSDDAHTLRFPIERFTRAREMAYAAVSRAAWHYAEGRRDSAEVILRAIVTYGFQVSDNASFAVDQLSGQALVALGRDALQRFYAMRGDPRSEAINSDMRRASRQHWLNSLPSSLADFNARRVEVNRAALEPAIPPGIRNELLITVARMSCGDGRELAFGMRQETRDIFERARRDFARYSSERSLIDVIERNNEIPVSAAVGPTELGALSTLDLLGRIYFNPRLAGCALSALQQRF
jgi:hypothetical protein